MSPLTKASAGPSFAADYAGALVVPASASNYTVANRPADYNVSMVVIHVAEGSAIGTAATFQNPSDDASANYVVAANGVVRQMVPEHDIAYHAGNWSVNTQSIGIEHEGYTAKGGFSAAEYRGSEGLLGAILTRYAIPPDRTHVIGHNEVPDPSHPGEFGGASHHTDPGKYWAWTQYLAGARLNAKDTRQSAVGLPGVRKAVRKGQTITYAPVIVTKDSYDLFAQTPCGWKPRRGVKTTASVLITAADRPKRTTLNVGPAACGSWIYVGTQSFAVGHARTVAITVPAHAGAPAIVAVETRDTHVPTLPGTVGISGITSNGAVASWLGGGDDIGIWGYTLQVGTGPVQRLRGASTLTVALGGLSCATAYPVAVSAIDLAGNASVPVTATFTTAVCPPQPVGVSASSSGSGVITVTWSAPAGAAVSGYRVSVDGAAAVSVAAPPYAATNLACGVTHSFAVQLVDSSGSASQPVTTTASAACVQPPGTLAVIAVTQTTATLGWTVPPAGGAPAGYTLTVGAAPGVQTAGTSATVSGLTCGTTVTGAVSSYDSAGNHSAAVSTPVTLAAC